MSEGQRVIVKEETKETCKILSASGLLRITQRHRLGQTSLSTIGTIDISRI